MTSSQSLLSSVALKSADITQLTDQPGFSADALVGLKIPLALSAYLGYGSVDLTVQSESIATTSLPLGINITQSADTALRGNVVLKPNTTRPIQALIDSLFGVSSVQGTVGIANLMMGGQGQPPIQTFNMLKFELQAEHLSPIVNQLRASSSGLLATVLQPGMIKVKGFDLDVRSSQEVIFGLQQDLNNQFNASLAVGAFSCSIGLSGTPVLDFGINQFGISRGLAPLNLAGQIAFKNAENSTEAMLKLQSGDATIEISNVRIGGGPGAAGPVIDMLAPIRVPIPVSLIAGALTAAASIPITQSPIDLSAMLPTMEMLSNLSLQVSGVQFMVASQATMKTSISAQLNNPLPISIRVPHFASTVTLGGKDSPLLTIQVSGLTLNRGPTTLQLSTDIVFPQSDQTMSDKVAALVQNILTGRMEPSIGIRDVSFGSGPQDKNALISMVHVDVGALFNQLGDMSTAASGILAQLTPMLQSVAGRLIQQLNFAVTPAQGGIMIQIMPNLLIHVQEVALIMLPGKQISAAVAVGLTLPFPLIASIPLCGISLGIDSLPFVTVSVKGVNVSGPSSTMRIETQLTIFDAAPLAELLGQISEAVLQGAPLANSIRVSGALIGAAESDMIASFSKVALPLPLSLLQQSAGQAGNVLGLMASRIDFIGILHSFGLGLNSVFTRGLEGKRVQAGAGVVLRNANMVLDIGHSSVSISIDNLPFMAMEGAEVKLSPQTKILNANALVVFPSSEAIQERVGAIFATVMQQGLAGLQSSILVTGFTFGASAQDHILCFSQIRLVIGNAAIPQVAAPGKPAGQTPGSAQGPAVALPLNRGPDVQAPVLSGPVAGSPVVGILQNAVSNEEEAIAEGLSRRSPQTAPGPQQVPPPGSQPPDPQQVSPPGSQQPPLQQGPPGSQQPPPQQGSPGSQPPGEQQGPPGSQPPGPQQGPPPGSQEPGTPQDPSLPRKSTLTLIQVLAPVLMAALNIDLQKLDPQILLQRAVFGKVNVDTSSPALVFESALGLQQVPLVIDVEMGFAGAIADLDGEL